jgi:SAM-dependent methyltransferase
MEADLLVREGSDNSLIKKIISKKEFSDLPQKDVLLAFKKFDSKSFADGEKLKLTRDLLRKSYTAFLSPKLLHFKDKDAEWFLKKHISTRERLPYYSEVYRKILFGLPKELNVYDLGCGTNGFSYDYFREIGFDVNYFGVEAVGQVVNLQKKFFDGKNLRKVSFFHESLFDLGWIMNLIKTGSGSKVVFLFKVLDSLEMIKRDYSKEFLESIVPLVDRVTISFATKSFLKRRKFFADRTWINNFVRDKFKILWDFEIGGERYITFSKKDL